MTSSSHYPFWKSNVFPDFLNGRLVLSLDVLMLAVENLVVWAGMLEKTKNVQMTFLPSPKILAAPPLLFPQQERITF